MFRKYYKKANEEIKASEALIQSTLRKMDKKPRKQIVSWFPIPAVVLCALLALCMFPHMLQEPETGSIPLAVVTKEPEAEKTEQPSPVPKVIQKPAKTKSPVFVPIKTQPPTSQIPKETEQPMQDEPVNTVAPSTEPHLFAWHINDRTPPLMGIPPKTGETEEWDIRHYLNYLGFDPLQNLWLPEGFQMTGEKKRQMPIDKDGNPTFDKWTFLHTSSDGKRLRIETTKKLANVQNQLENEAYQPTFVKENKTLFFRWTTIFNEQNVNMYQVIFLKNDVSFQVFFEYGFTEEQVKKVIYSLI